MVSSNATIASMLEEIADFLEVDEANPFRINAYRNAARSVATLARSISDMVEMEEDLTRLSGIGKELAVKVREAATTGNIDTLYKLRAAHRPGLNGLFKVPGLGPKKIRVLLKERDIGSINDLKQAAAAGKLRSIPGFGSKTEQNILNVLNELN